MKKKKIIILVLTIVLLLIDQISKIIITNSLSIGESKNVIDGFFSFNYVQNTGAAWGVLSNGSLILAILSAIFLIFFIKYIVDLKKLSMFSVFDFSLLLAGIMGNMLDRFIRGFVVDFFDFVVFSYDYPVFNVADIFIVVGIILLLINMFIEGDYNDSK